MRDMFLLAEETLTIWSNGKKLFVEYHGTDRNGNGNFVHSPYYGVVHEGFGSQKEYRTPVSDSLSEVVRAIYGECFKRCRNSLRSERDLLNIQNVLNRDDFKFWHTSPSPLFFEKGIV